VATGWLLSRGADALKERHADDESVECEVADCRALPSLDGSVCVVVDKGTLDALHGDEDKMMVLRECNRILTKSGVLVSISFGAARRIGFLTKAATVLNMHLHIHVVGDGDPCSGHQVSRLP
jgi:ubiquinone/menaquinone biosynthesis C-methylase UbiE